MNKKKCEANKVLKRKSDSVKYVEAEDFPDFFVVDTVPSAVTVDLWHKNSLGKKPYLCDNFLSPLGLDNSSNAKREDVASISNSNCMSYTDLSEHIEHKENFNSVDNKSKFTDEAESKCNVSVIDCDTGENICIDNYKTDNSIHNKDFLSDLDKPSVLKNSAKEISLIFKPKFSTSVAPCSYSSSDNSVIEDENEVQILSEDKIKPVVIATVDLLEEDIKNYVDACCSDSLLDVEEVYSCTTVNASDDNGDVNDDIVIIEEDSNSSCDEDDIEVVSNENFVSIKKLSFRSLNGDDIYIGDEVFSLRETFENMRKWELTRLGQAVMHGRQYSNETNFVLMSYNVLSQSLLLDNPDLYKNCNSKYCDWKYRWPLISYEISNLQPDILTLQEVESTHYHTHFLPWLSNKGYNGLFKKRTGFKPDGCAIFFKASKFNLLEHCSIEYNQPKGGRSLDRDNIALIAKLRPLYGSDLEFCVATTHLLYNPKRNDVRLAQIMLLLTELDHFCYIASRTNSCNNGQMMYCPAILTGDFNCQPFAEILKFLNQGRLLFKGNSFSSLLPPALGINNMCQHTLLTEKRSHEKQHGGNIFNLSDTRKIEDKLIGLFHSEQRQNPKPFEFLNVSLNPAFHSEDLFTHNFRFQSVYKHTSKNGMEQGVSTKQNYWMCVDYILYSKISPSDKTHGKRLIEGPLKLIGKYTLPSEREAEMVSPLPSAVCPSDHFCVAANFLLKGSKKSK